MKSEILKEEIQDYITSNLQSDMSKLVLKGMPFKTVESNVVFEQIESKKRCQKKLPTWFNTQNIYYPNKLNIEQTSSETTAIYKANLVSGKQLIDLTGGFGVDSYYFSKAVTNVIHCEINESLSAIACHNFKALKVSNITCYNEDGTSVLKKCNEKFDWIYVDPSRRDKIKKKVFLLADCEPNIKDFQDFYFTFSNNLLIKTSPLLDLTATLRDIQYVKEIHIVAVKNDVKELLWVIENKYSGHVKVMTTNIKDTNSEDFNFVFAQEPLALPTYSEPGSFLYEPNAAILKSGGFNSISTTLNVNKLHQNSHLYTSDVLLEFPGRRFKVEQISPFNKKLFKQQHITKANITTRNFPISVSDIRKKFKIKDGGTLYLFFTTDFQNKKIIITCTKV
ncbi:class I SAM-dependent methyltransferase [Winogradskyella eckloniae]|uniref:THUMP-like domain-containing protein n=1 Tax=Winogradskyella eckloniae TaxID=1089306 RepID=UPI001566997F|nr:class I SAM-dependent methyltransferase [Winogradskyella eckloniae]NRD20254.1 class I SAM-dependent methyltransferase [Winogradskyella eckloniae]